MKWIVMGAGGVGGYFGGRLAQAGEEVRFAVSGVGAVARAAARITRLSTLAKRGGSFAE